MAVSTGSTLFVTLAIWSYAMTSSRTLWILAANPAVIGLAALAGLVALARFALRRRGDA